VSIQKEHSEEITKVTKILTKRIILPNKTAFGNKSKWYLYLYKEK